MLTQLRSVGMIAANERVLTAQTVRDEPLMLHRHLGV
jgi:hypothetical protein